MMLPLPMPVKLALVANLLLAENARRQVLKGLEPPPYNRRPRYTVSAVIPAYQEEKYIANAIRSLKNQTEPVHEIIVADSSPDNFTESVASSFGCLVVGSRPGNASFSRNLGARSSNGNILLFLDSDMVLSNQIVEQFIDKLESGATLAHPTFCYHDSMFWNSLFFIPGSLRPKSMASGCVMIWADKFREMGGFDETCNPFAGGEKCMEMHDLAKRCMSKYGPDSVQVLTGMLIGASARRFKAFGLTTDNTLSVPVRQSGRVRIIL